MFTVLIADDHVISGKGLAQALHAYGGFEVLAHAENGLDAIAQTKIRQPDLAVFDMIMPGVSGLEALIEARRWSPGTRFAILTGGATSEQLQAVLDAKANGLFLKTAPVEEICAGLEQVAQGETVLSPSASQFLQQAAAHRTSNARLTARETEVLRGIARGWSNAQIASHLGLSTKTIDSHRTGLMRKLEVKSAAALIVRAVRDGLIDVSGPI